MGPRTKKSPTSPTWQRNDVEPNMEAPEGGSSAILPLDDLRTRGASVHIASTELPPVLSQGVAELVRLTGLDEAAVLRHLISSALFWCGLNGYGRNSWEHLAEVTMGKEQGRAFLKEATEESFSIETEGPYRVARQRGAEADAAFPGDWPASYWTDEDAAR